MPDPTTQQEREARDVDLECRCVNCGQRYGSHWGTHCFDGNAFPQFAPARPLTPETLEPFGYWCKFQDGSEAFLHLLPSHPDYGDVPTHALPLYPAARSLPPTDAPSVWELQDALQNVVNVYGTDSPMWNQARAALARHEGEGKNG